MEKVGMILVYPSTVRSHMPSHQERIKKDPLPESYQYGVQYCKICNGILDRDGRCPEAMKTGDGRIMRRID